MNDAYLWIEIWSMAIKLSGPRAFRPLVTVVAVVIAPFFMAIIIAMWSSGRGGRSSAEPFGTWSTWSVVDVVGARLSCSRRGRRGRSSVELLETWSMWPMVDVAARSVRWSEGMYLVPSHGEAKALGHVEPRSDIVGDIPCLHEGYGVA